MKFINELIGEERREMTDAEVAELLTPSQIAEAGWYMRDLNSSRFMIHVSAENNANRRTGFIMVEATDGFGIE